MNMILWTLSVILAAGRPGLARDLPLEKLQLPPGFRIEVYAGAVPGARSMALGEKGTLFVGTRSPGCVYAITERNREREVQILAQGLDSPNGVAFQDGALYVAEISRILRFDAIESRLKDPPPPVVVNDSFPKHRSHGWKFIRFGPDGMLYVPVGAPCNVCERREKAYASILRMRADGTGLEVFASGVRNTVGFDWEPVTRQLWFTDNGRDSLGNDRPPDELNRAPGPGLHFGFPYCHGRDIADPQFGKGRNCSEFTPPVRELGPHVASLGMRFYTGTQFPPIYRGQIFIAEHGSWNRTTPIGYRITLVRVEKGRALSYEPFAQGWLEGGKAWGRPVDIQELPDGSLLVSDDKAGCIYRITYSDPRGESAPRR
jgi:glucose/arabinose dehydrogenase